MSDFLTATQRRAKDMAAQRQVDAPSVEERVAVLEQQVDRIEATVAPTAKETP